MRDRGKLRDTVSKGIVYPLRPSGIHDSDLARPLDMTARSVPRQEPDRKSSQEKGIAERSFIEYLDVDSNQTASSSTYLEALANELTRAIVLALVCKAATRRSSCLSARPPRCL
jgi:hypothetical protein